MQPGDVLETCADVSELAEVVGFTPKTSISDGISRFVDWYLSYAEGKLS
jgi:UDP-glucuronate 4-epimerase